MAWAKATQILAWSFSRYSAYKKCPLSLKLDAIDKIRAPKNAAMQRGNDIHKDAEDYMKGITKKLPESLAYFPNFFAKMRKLYKAKPHMITVEDQWAFRKDWSRTVWNDWNECWVRIKLDLAYLEDDGKGTLTVHVVDFKTGKFSPQFSLPEYIEQLDLYATAALVIHADKGPNIRVIPRLFYLDHEIIYPEPGAETIYTPADLPRLKKQWEKSTKPMLADKTFAPKPNSLCGFCFYGQAGKIKSGGPGLCKF